MYERRPSNRRGSGGYSRGATAGASATTPGAPTIGVATAGDTTATANWTAPASDGGSAITGYEVKTYAASNDALLETNTVGVVLTYQDTGRTNGTGVYFKVAAINAVGTGSQSAASNTVTPALAPPSSGKAYHFDASILPDADGTALATWTNQGSAGDATQPTGSLQPLVKTNILNGLRVVRFDGVDWMRGPPNTIPQPFQMFIVINVTGGSYVALDGGNTVQFYMLSGNAYIWAGTQIGAAQAKPTGFHRWRLTFTGTDTMHKDGAAFVSGNAGANALGRLTIAADHAGGTASACDVAEILIYDRILSAGEITTVESYLQAKWGV